MSLLEPKYRGRFVGQCVCREVKVATGKRFPLETATGIIWIPVKEKRIIIDWAWTGDRWVTGEQWDADNIRTAPPGTKFPSKNDFDDAGGRAVTARRTQPKEKRVKRTNPDRGVLVWTEGRKNKIGGER